MVCHNSHTPRLLRAALALVLGLATSVAVALEINGVQPYSLDQPRVPALLTPANGGAPLSTYSELFNQHLFAFDCFLDTGASRMVLSRGDRDALKVKATGQRVEDYGIAGTEWFDVSVPYRIYVGDSTTNTANAQQFRLGMQCVLQLRRSDQSPLTAMPKGLTDQLNSMTEGLGVSAKDIADTLTPAVNIVGTPFLQNHVAILDPKPVTAALGALGGMVGGGTGGGGGGGDAFAMLDKLLEQLQKSGANPMSASVGRMSVRLLRSGQHYPPARIAVPLTMTSIEPKPVPVSKADLPFINGVVLQNGARSCRVNLLLDTGGGMSLISTRVARQLGVNLSNPPLTAMVQGVGKGASTLKGHWLSRMSLHATRGGPVVYNRVPFFVADIASIDGTIGANFLIPSVYMDMNMEKMMANPMALLGSMKNGPMPFSRIVIDIPRKQLGLDPA